MNLYQTVADIFNSFEVEERDAIVELFFNGEYDRGRVERWYSDDAYWSEFHKTIDDRAITISYEYRTGGEGEGEEYWSVYSFTNEEGTVYIKFNGYYQSYEGATFDEFYQVVPKQRTITVYEQV